MLSSESLASAASTSPFIAIMICLKPSYFFTSACKEEQEEQEEGKEEKEEKEQEVEEEVEEM